MLRATQLTARLCAFADELAHASGAEVVFLLDGRYPVTVDTQRGIILLTRKACEEAGLFCPEDFAWRCGDYGLYFARLAFPEIAHFWIVEYDVRFAGGDASLLFSYFAARPGPALLATHYAPATKDWYWYWQGIGRGVTPYKCLFPLLRVDAAALSLGMAKRVAHSRDPRRRRRWPNDEVFLATTLTHAKFECRDLNDFGVPFYNEATFSFHAAFDGDDFPPDVDGLRAFHPVLWGEDYARKVLALGTQDTAGRPSGLRRQLGMVRRTFQRFRAW